MANQFIKDLVRKERTQANLTGMTVDTQSRFLMNPMSTELIATPKPNANIPEYKNIFLEKLEEFAGWAENLKINNEKSKLKIAMQKMDLDLEERWKPRENTDKYREAYGEYTQERMKVYNEKQKLIRSCNYLTQEEKQKSFTDLKMSLNTDNYNQNGKRTKIFTADQIADAVANIQERAEITANFGLDKDTEAQENYRDILNDYRQIAKLTGEQPKITLNKAINEITKIEATRLHKDMQAKLSDPNLTEAKMREIENQLKNFENSEVHKALAREFVDKIGIKTEDKEQTLEYIKTSFGNRIGTLSKSINTSLKVIRRQRQAEARRRQREIAKAIQEFKDLHSKAYNSGDYSQMEYALTKKGIKGKRWENRIFGEIETLNSNPINSDVYHITGKTIPEINASGEFVIGYLPKQVLDDIETDKNNLINEGTGETEALIEAVSQKSCGNEKMTEFIVKSFIGSRKDKYTRKIKLGIKAKFGDEQAQDDLKNIDKIDYILSNGKGSEKKIIDDKYSDYNDSAKELKQQLIKNGMDSMTAHKRVGEFLVGLDLLKGENKSNYRRKKEVRETLKKYANSSEFIRAFKISNDKGIELKSVELRGDLKL